MAFRLIALCLAVAAISGSALRAAPVKKPADKPVDKEPDEFAPPMEPFEHLDVDAIDDESPGAPATSVSAVSKGKSHMLGSAMDSLHKSLNSDEDEKPPARVVEAPKVQQQKKKVPVDDEEPSPKAGRGLHALAAALGQ